MIIGRIRENLKPMRTVLLHDHIDPTGRMKIIDLDKSIIKIQLFQPVPDICTIRVPPYPGDKSHGHAELMKVISEIKRRSADPAVVRKNIEQYFARNNNHTKPHFIYIFENNII